MRIGYDAKRIFHNFTGLGNYSRSLVEMMAKFYPRNSYLLFNPKPAPLRRMEQYPSVKTVTPSGIWKFFPALWRSRGILRDLRRQNIDVYHGLSGELPLGISRTGIPSVLTVHDVIFLRFPQWYKPADRKIYTWKLKHALKEATRIVAISRQTKKDIMEFFHIAPGRIDVIYQTCHPAFKKNYSSGEIGEVKEKFGIEAPFVLYVGTIEPRKNAFTLVKALKDLPYSAVLVGRKTAYGEEVEKYVRTHGMHDRVRFLEGLMLEELAVLYRLAKVSVYPSIYEGFGIPIIESLFAGTPVITNAAGVFPEAAGPGGIYLNDIFDVGEMKEKLQYAMENDLEELSKKGRAYVHKMFDEKKLAAQWDAAYRQIRK